ncbi:MAG: hypothetical protein NVSMB42_14100 [Herpetosiphon sp.]
MSSVSRAVGEADATAVVDAVDVAMLVPSRVASAVRVPSGSPVRVGIAVPVVAVAVALLVLSRVASAVRVPSGSPVRVDIAVPVVSVAVALGVPSRVASTVRVFSGAPVPVAITVPVTVGDGMPVVDVGSIVVDEEDGVMVGDVPVSRC